jgi:membrane protein insertase Oxa1/YidC/SpoIIIJ
LYLTFKFKGHAAVLLYFLFHNAFNFLQQHFFRYKKQIKETGAAIAKQVKATAEHLDMVHDYIGFEAHPNSGHNIFCI